MQEVGAICPDECALYIADAPGTLACADGVVRWREGDPLGFVPDDLLGDDPEGVKAGLRAAYARIADELEFEALLLAHGGPMATGGRQALAAFATSALTASSHGHVPAEQLVGPADGVLGLEHREQDRGDVLARDLAVAAEARRQVDLAAAGRVGQPARAHDRPVEVRAGERLVGVVLGLLVGPHLLGGRRGVARAHRGDHQVAAHAERLGGLDQLDRAAVVDGALALGPAAGAGAGGEHDRVGGAEVRGRVVLLEVAQHRHGAVGLEVGRVVGVADQAAGVVAGGGELPEEMAGDLSVPAGDEDIHATEATGARVPAREYRAADAPSSGPRHLHARPAARLRRGRPAHPVRPRLRAEGRRPLLPDHRARRPGRELRRRAARRRRHAPAERRRPVPDDRDAARLRRQQDRLRDRAEQHHLPLERRVLRQARLRRRQHDRARVRPVVRRAGVAHARLRAGLAPPRRPALRGARHADAARPARRPGHRQARRARRHRHLLRRRPEPRARLPARPHPPRRRLVRAVEEPEGHAARDRRRLPALAVVGPRQLAAARTGASSTTACRARPRAACRSASRSSPTRPRSTGSARRPATTRRRASTPAPT